MGNIKKLKLEDLEVQSFVTSVPEDDDKKIKGELPSRAIHF